MSFGPFSALFFAKWGFFLLWYSVLCTIESLSLLYLLFISWFICSRRWCMDKLGSIMQTNIYVSWSTSELRVRFARHETGLSPPVKYFYWLFQSGLLLWDICVINVLCLSCLLVCLLQPWGHLKGKDWPLDSCLWCLLWFCYFPIWYPGTGVVSDCIDSWSLLSFLLSMWYLMICSMDFLHI